jgi:HPt (histidine-containing phosphotransfer) domain-containing protein
MKKDEDIKDIEKVCNLSYIAETMGGKKHLIKEILGAFLIQVPEELNCINEAISKTDYATIKRIAHKMRSSISIMGISELETILVEIESYGKEARGIEEVKELNSRLNSICRKAFEEIENEIQNYN